MTQQLYLDFFNLICLGLLGWGFIRAERAYQFPFFMGAIFVSFILPQAIALRNNPTVVTPEALSRVLLMCCLCAAMCWVGYQSKPSVKLLRLLDVSLDERKLFQSGLVLLAISYSSSFALSRTTIQTTNIGTWTGPATILFFFANVVYIAFTIFLLQFLKRPNVKYLIFTAIASYPILQAVIFAGRRQSTITFLILIGSLLWFVHRLIPPRWVFILATCFGLYLIPLIGAIRGDFWELLFSGDWQTLSNAAQNSFESLLEGEILELRNAAIMMDAAARTNQFGYGSGFWDSIVFQYVPGQLVGYGLKSDLQVKLTQFDFLKLYNYDLPPGTTPTAIGDTFVEFHYFGCLVLALMAWFYKTLWISALERGSIFSTLLYASLISPAMIGITHGIGRFCQELLFYLIFVGLTVLYSRSKTPTYQVVSPTEYS